MLLGAVALVVAAPAGCSKSAGVGADGGIGGGSIGGAGGRGAEGGGSAAIDAGIGGSGGVVGAGGGVGSGGGSAGAAGVASSGGIAGSAGVASSGGIAGAAGVAGSGGVAGSDGVAGAGGISPSGGVAGSAGVGGAGGLPDEGPGSGGKGGTEPTGGRGGSLSASGGGGSMGMGGAGGSAISCLPPAASAGGTVYCSNSRGNAGPGYAYEIYSSGQGSGCMTVYGVKANFSATWTETTDFLARAGLRFDQTKTPAQLGTISADFTEVKTESPTAGRTSKIYFAVYGWTVSPLAEYYVMEDYGSFVPGPVATDGSPRTHLGTFVVDDGTYDLWHLAVKNKPAITGDNKDFDQYFSVRQSRRPCGHISVSEQFSKWATLGVQLGKMEEAMFLMEAQGNSGTIDVAGSLGIK